MIITFLRQLFSTSLKQNIFLLSIIGSLGSCEKENDIEFSIINASDHNVEIVGFSRNSQKIADTIYLKPNQVSLNYRYSSGTDLDERTFYSIMHVDSVHLLFEKKKLQVIVSTDNPYTTHPLVNPLYRVAAITNDDYEEAIPINSNN